MRKNFIWIYLAFLAAGCGKSADIPLPQAHPAYSFYQTARTLNVSSRSCVSAGGSLEIRPDQINVGLEYQKIRELAPGLFLVNQTASQRKWVAVIFMENGLMASLPKTCSWDTEKFPVLESK